MNRKVRTFLPLLAIAGVLAAAPAGAQSNAGDQPVMFGANTGEYRANGFALRGAAEVLQGDNRLRADAIDGTSSDGALQRVEASGNVYFVTPTQTIRGDRAVYTLGNGDVVVSGDVVMTQGRNVLTGGRLVYNVRTEQARMEGAPRAGSGSRIQGVLYPSGD